MIASDIYLLWETWSVEVHHAKLAMVSLKMLSVMTKKNSVLACGTI